MLLCRNRSSDLSSDFRTDQLSHPHKSRLQGMALNNRYFENLSTYLLSQIIFSAPMEALAAANLFVTS